MNPRRRFSLRSASTEITFGGFTQLRNLLARRLIAHAKWQRFHGSYTRNYKPYLSGGIHLLFWLFNKKYRFFTEQFQISPDAGYGGIRLS